MGRITITILSTIVGLALMLAAVGFVLFSALAVADIHQPAAHALALTGELIFGIALLVGATFLASQFAVWVAGEPIGSVEGRGR